MNKLGRYWRTLRALTIRQLVVQVLVRLRSRPKLKVPQRVAPAYFLAVPEAAKPVSYRAGMFTFLNRSAYNPDWNGNKTAGYGKLWTYHLNYFDFLNQPGMPVQTGLALIADFMVHTHTLRDGLEPYPTSLRIMNWIQFLSRHRIRNRRIDAHLTAQLRLLSRRLEYHLSGNHLLENSFALLTGSLYFRNRDWFYTAAGLLQNELQQQILADGGHYERSPVYHQALLDQLLTVLTALQPDAWHRSQNASLLDFLNTKAQQMLNWLEAITFSNGDVPMVNDAAVGLTPGTAQLREKAALLPVTESADGVPLLGESGYRMFRYGRYELVADAGPVGPDHQPGHAHADTLSFVLYADNQPLIVDSGTSTYQPGARRLWERGTAAHNTVSIQNGNSSEVWASFRVGRRARVTVLDDTPVRLTARHDGYRNRGFVHERSWSTEPDQLIIHDRLIPVGNGQQRPGEGIARFYIHPDVQVRPTGHTVRVGDWVLSVQSETPLAVSIEHYEMADGFNQLRAGACIRVDFANSLITRIFSDA